MDQSFYAQVSEISSRAIELPLTPQQNRRVCINECLMSYYFDGVFCSSSSGDNFGELCLRV